MVGATRLATHLSGVHGWNASGVVGKPGTGGVPGKGTGPQNTNGCIPSDNQPQKCPGYLSGNPVAGGTPRAVGRPHTYYYHPDHLGSTSWVTDESSRVREHVSYFPYGSVWRDPRGDADGAAPQTQAFLFTGKEYDQETGLYYFGARYYDPEVARWLSTDPVVLGAGSDGVKLSLYAYASWRPLVLTDPTGRGKPSAYDSVKGAARFFAGETEGMFAGGLTTLAQTAYALTPEGREEMIERIEVDIDILEAFPESSDVYQSASLELNRLNPIFCILEGSSKVEAVYDTVQKTPMANYTTAMGKQLGSADFEIAKGGADTVALAAGGLGLYSAALDAFSGGADALAGANFAQLTYRETFSSEGAFSGLTIDEVAEALRSGRISPADVPVEYIVRGEDTLILNTRSAQALERAGIPRAKWNAVNMTGDPAAEVRLSGQLMRNGLTNKGTPTVTSLGTGK